MFQRYGRPFVTALWFRFATMRVFALNKNFCTLALINMFVPKFLFRFPFLFLTEYWHYALMSLCSAILRPALLKSVPTVTKQCIYFAEFFPNIAQSILVNSKSSGLDFLFLIISGSYEIRDGHVYNLLNILFSFFLSNISCGRLCY